VALIDYSNATWPIRPDLPAAHGRAWRRLASPGAWWAASERVAIAQQVRAADACRLCIERKASLSPFSCSGSHDGPEGLPGVAVDAIHRLVTDPGRLSKKWYASLEGEGLSSERYVELLGVVVTVVSIDSFCRGLGLPLNPLPEPLPGEPSHYRPEGVEERGAWVPWIAGGGEASAERDLFEGLPGRSGNVIRAMSLVPDEVRTLNDLSAAHYMAPGDAIDPRWSPFAIDRLQIELLAGRVSALRECFY
jgi:hypothetical protein